MAEIYAKARLVVIFPGSIIAELDNLDYDANGTAVHVTEGNRERIGKQWTQAEWRTRCWTYQEAAMARATAVVTGSRKKPVLSGAALDALATTSSPGDASDSVKLSPWHPLDDTWLRANAHTYKADQECKHHLFSRSYRVCEDCGLSKDQPPEKQPLLVLMGLSWNRNASRDLDTVFSLLSMAENGDKVPVRYDTTMEDLYRLLIQTKVVGAEILALGGGFVGSTTWWMPNRNNSEHGQRHLHFQGLVSSGGPPDNAGRIGALETVEASITGQGTLTAAVVPVTISTRQSGSHSDWLLLHLAGFGKPLRVQASKVSPPAAGWQAHVLAPLTCLGKRGGQEWWRLVLVYSSGTGYLNHVEKTQIFNVRRLNKTGIESYSVVLIHYGI